MNTMMQKEHAKCYAYVNNEKREKERRNSENGK